MVARRGDHLPGVDVVRGARARREPTARRELAVQSSAEPSHPAPPQGGSVTVLTRLWPFRRRGRGRRQWVAEHEAAFCRSPRRRDVEQTLLAPELPPHGGERVAEGGRGLGYHASVHTAARAGGQGARRAGSRARTARAGTAWCGRSPGPTTGAGSRRRGGRAPPRTSPRPTSAARTSAGSAADRARVGAEKGLRLELARRVAHQHPADRHDRLAGWYQTAVPETSSTAARPRRTSRGR